MDGTERTSMTRRQKDPLRLLTPDEQSTLDRLSRSQTEPASHVARAKALLAVAAGVSYSAAAQAAGRRSGDAVAHLVTRFNQHGLVAIVPGHGGGPPPTYTLAERNRILAEARRTPDREADGTATWSLLTLRQTLRTAPDGLPKVSTGTIRAVLLEAGWSWQRSRSWCETGTAQRKRKHGVVTVVDPDAEAKKS
jgi:transposase